MQAMYMKLTQTKLIITICCICGAFYGCNVSGQIGSTFNFHKDKQQLEAAIDTLYAQHPEYKVPPEWAKYNNPPLSTAPYIENKLFYFKDSTREMYCVTLIDDSAMSRDSARSGLAIRAINKGSDKWLRDEDAGYKEQKRIEKRFDKEIIAKLEVITGSKVRREE
jgi:hypothetical protein